MVYYDNENVYSWLSTICVCVTDIVWLRARLPAMDLYVFWFTATKRLWWATDYFTQMPRSTVSPQLVSLHLPCLYKNSRSRNGNINSLYSYSWFELNTLNRINVVWHLNVWPAVTLPLTQQARRSITPSLVDPLHTWSVHLLYNVINTKGQRPRLLIKVVRLKMGIHSYIC